MNAVTLRRTSGAATDERRIDILGVNKVDDDADLLPSAALDPSSHVKLNLRLHGDVAGLEVLRDRLRAKKATWKDLSA